MQCTVIVTYQWSPNVPTNCALLSKCGLALWLPNTKHAFKNDTQVYFFVFN